MEKRRSVVRALLPILLTVAMCASACVVSKTDVTTTAEASSAETTEKETTKAETTTTAETTVTEAETMAESSETEVEYHDDDYAAEDADPETVAAETAAPADPTPAQQQYEAQKTEIQAREAEISASSQIPCIYINTLNNASPASKDEYLDCTVDVFNVTDGSAMSGTAASVRVRGNSSAQTEKPPLKIKFAERQNLVGLHNGETFKVWVILKTNWFLTADHLAFKLGKTLLGENRYVSDSKFVHVYVNGIDWGICVACEQNQIQTNRVNVKEAESESTSPTDMGYFFEMDNYAGSDDAPTFWITNSENPVTDINGVTHRQYDKGYTLKNSYISDAQLAYISAYMNSVWQVLWRATYENTAYVINADGSISADGSITPEEAVNRVLDVDSAVNIFILEEIFHDYDRGAGSFFMAVDFSDTSVYQKVTFLAPWDFGYDVWSDDGTGLHTGVFTTSGDVNDSDNIWLISLYKNEWFRKLVYARYAELVQSGALKATTAGVEADLNALNADAALTGQESSVGSAHQFIAYTNNRIDWLASYFAAQTN